MDKLDSPWLDPAWLKFTSIAMALAMLCLWLMIQKLYGMVHRLDKKLAEHLSLDLRYERKTDAEGKHATPARLTIAEPDSEAPPEDGPDPDFKV